MLETQPASLTDKTDDSRRKVLFVDDEQKVLEGLRRMLRSQRHKWQMTYT